MQTEEEMLRPHDATWLRWTKQENGVFWTNGRRSSSSSPALLRALPRFNAEDCDEGFEHWEDVWSVGQRRRTASSNKCLTSSNKKLLETISY